MGWRSNARYVVEKVAYSPAGILTGAASTYYVYDKYGNVVYEFLADPLGTSDLSDDLTNLGNDLLIELEGLSVDVLDTIEDVALEVAEAGLELLKGAGLAVLSGAELMFDYTYSKVSPHRVEAVTAVTALLVYITTGVIMFKKIKGAN